MTPTGIISASSFRSGDATRHAWYAVGMLALGHMLIDGTSIYTATSLAAWATAAQDPLWIMAMYNCLAFAPQIALGWIVDRLKSPSLSACIGALMVVAAALIWPHMPMQALCLAGLGNALYHVGAGSLCLQFAGGRAAMAGVFVGPGSIGVILGTFMGSGWWPGAEILIVACTLLALWVAFLRVPATLNIPPCRCATWSAHALAIVLLLLAVASRQLVAGAVNGSWFTLPWAWILIAVAATVGKITLGFAADRFGWLLIGAGLAALAAPLVAASQGHLCISVAAAILAQAAMPVTLAGLSRLLPRYPALAFGLTSCAIWLGSRLADIFPQPIPPAVLLGTQLTAACAIAAAILLMRRTTSPTST
jgi:FSR family fosmidomycin resistance protein-like MFS transporter